MPITFQNSKPMQDVLEIYESKRVEQGVEQQSLVSRDQPATWGNYFGFTYTQGRIDNLNYPQAGGLTESYRDLLNLNQENETIKNNCNYFYNVYNLCYQYLADNQSRYLNAARLDSVSHNKIFAVTLLAHLCEKGMHTVDKQNKCKERIKGCVQKFLTMEALTASTSNDANTLSLRTTLEMINAEADKDSSNEKPDAIRKMYAKIGKAIGCMKSSQEASEDYVLALLTAQSSIDSTQLTEQLSTEKTRSAVMTELLSKPVIAEIYRKRAQNTPDERFNGLDYSLTSSSCFLTSRFSPEQTKNLVELLKCQDQLAILQEALSELYEQANRDQTAYLNDFITLADAYLKKIHGVKGKLQFHLEKFNMHCGEVYFKRKNENALFNRERSVWESQYNNKTRLEKYRKKNNAFGTALNKSIATIPFNLFNALEERFEKTKAVFERGQKLLGNSIYEQGRSGRRELVAQAQEQELDRQNDLIIIQLQDLLNGYDDIVKKVTQSEDETLRNKLPELEYKQRILQDTITKIKSSKKDTLEFDDNLPRIEAEEYRNFFNDLNSYLANRAPTELATRLTKQLDMVRENLGSREALIERLNTKLESEKGAGIDKQKQISKLESENKNLRVENFKLKISTYSWLTPKNTQFLIAWADKNTNTDFAELENLISNCQKIVRQGQIYKETYKEKSGAMDRGWFFSHNDNGKNHAETVMVQWQKDLNADLNSAVSNIFRNIESGDPLAELSAAIQKNVAASVSRLIQDRYSSYKQHSFRTYLHRFYGQVTNQEAPIDWKKPMALQEKEDIFGAVNGFFNPDSLKDLEHQLKLDQPLRSNLCL